MSDGIRVVFAIRFFKVLNVVCGCTERLNSTGLSVSFPCRRSFMPRETVLPMLIDWFSAISDLAFFWAALLKPLSSFSLSFFALGFLFSSDLDSSRFWREIPLVICFLAAFAESAFFCQLARTAFSGFYFG